MNFDDLYNIACENAKEIKLTNKSSYGKVATAVLTKDGNIYIGTCFKTTCNVGFCAEESAIAQMLRNNETEISKMVAVYDSGEIISPCGKCREQIYQLNPNNLKCEILLKDRITTLEELLPEL